MFLVQKKDEISISFLSFSFCFRGKQHYEAKSNPTNINIFHHFMFFSFLFLSDIMKSNQREKMLLGTCTSSLNSIAP